MRPLNQQELHNLAMNIVGRQLEELGYEFLGVNSDLKKNPQFVCTRDKETIFVLVRSVNYPEDPKVFDEQLVVKIKERAQKYNAKTFYAGVGLANAETALPPVLLNQEYIVDYDGLLEV